MKRPKLKLFKGGLFKVYCVPLMVIFVVSGGVNAAQFEFNQWTVNVHGYGDLEYTRMSEMPMRMPLIIREDNHPMGMPLGMHITESMYSMASSDMASAMLATWFAANKSQNMMFSGLRNMSMSGMPYVGDDGKMWMNMAMGDMAVLSMHHTNILLDLQKSNIRFHLNAQGLHVLSNEDKYEAEATLRDKRTSVAAAYGSYGYSDALQFTTGLVIPPFGIYNDVYYITPLFATVVLPEMYEAQPNYLRQNSRRNFLPKNANFMLSGTLFLEEWELEYAAYLGKGKDEFRSDEGVGFGFKFGMTSEEGDLAFGISYYTGEQEDDVITTSLGDSYGPLESYLSPGKETVFGFDIEWLTLGEALRAQFEYVSSSFDGDDVESRSSYYARVIWEGWDRFKPFIMYDNFVDDDDELFKRTMNRIGFGGSYRFSDNLYLKAEYHYHYFSDTEAGISSSSDPALPSDTDPSTMFRTSIIYAF